MENVKILAPARQNWWFLQNFRPKVAGFWQKVPPLGIIEKYLRGGMWQKNYNTEKL